MNGEVTREALEAALANAKTLSREDAFVLLRERAKLMHPDDPLCQWFMREMAALLDLPRLL